MKRFDMIWLGKSGYGQLQNCLELESMFEKVIEIKKYKVLLNNREMVKG